jgi:hypothetical protein
MKILVISKWTFPLFSIKGLSAIIFLWTSITFGYVYLAQVSFPSIEKRRALVASVVRGQEKADYLHAMFTVATVQQWLIDRFGRPGRWFALERV